MEKENLIFIDTETTGLEEKDRLFQVAYEFEGKEINELFKPPVPISCGAMATTHYTNEDVENKEKFLNSKTWKHLNEILKDNIFVAHNAEFDIKILEKENLKINNYIDTLKVAHFLDQYGKLESYGLQFLRYCLKLKVEDAPAHDALGDIRVLKALFFRLFNKMKENLKEDELVLQKMIEISQKPIKYKKISFGKYKDWKLEDILKEDKGYLEWLLREKRKEEIKDENWIYTLEDLLDF